MLNSIESKKADRIRTFTHLTERFCLLLQRESLTVKPYGDGGPVHFSALPDPLQEHVLQSFEKYVGVCVETIAGGWSLRDDAQVLWRMFKSLRVHPCNELMASIEQGDVIEIYDTNYTQVFRNIAFFSICSYTLDELLARPFYELFRRDESVTAQLIQVGTEMFGGRLSGVHQWTVGQHTLNEVGSPALYEMEMQEKIASPLQDTSSQVKAILTTCRILSCVSKRTGAKVVLLPITNGNLPGEDSRP